MPSRADSAELRFPEGFLWGTAASSHQVEGDDPQSDWSAWEAQPGRIHDGTRAGRACEWWSGRAEEDLERARAMGHTAIRLSLEWSRLEREPGRFDDDAFARYARMLEKARALGLTAIVGLNHFTLPRWLAVRGGWLAHDVADRFARYADRAARVLGAHVPMWTTLNEPSVLALMAYFGTEWPPGLGDPRAGMRALRAQLLAHAAAYHALHDVLRARARVGLVLNVPALDPADPTSAADRAVAAAQDWAFSGVVLDALAHARFRFPLALRTEPAPPLRGALDFLGLNYYGRYRVRFDPSRPAELFGRRLADGTVHTDHNDWGEVFPEGLTRGLLRLARAFPELPLYVTENGIYDPDDAVRPSYLVEHVRAVHDAIARGADVRGYLVWSLIDNFEWAEGWSTPFGLLALDRATQARTPRRSAALFSSMCAANGVPAGMLDERGAPLPA